MSDIPIYTDNVEWLRYVYLNRAWWAQRHDDRRSWEPKMPPGWRCFGGHDHEWLSVDAISIALDNAIAAYFTAPEAPRHDTAASAAAIDTDLSASEATPSGAGS